MTKEEKAELEFKKASAGDRCKDVYATIQQIQSILATYYKDYYRWRDRYKKADEELAEVEKLTKVPSPGKGGKKKKQEPIFKLTKQQIVAIAEVLQVKLELNFDEEEGGEKNGNQT